MTTWLYSCYYNGPCAHAPGTGRLHERIFSLCGGVHNVSTAEPFWKTCSQKSRSIPFSIQPLCIGYRLRWRSDIWRTDRGVAEVRSPDIRPATEDDIRHNAPGLFETVDQLLRTKVRRNLLNQDKPSRLASYALQQHKAKSARLAASEFSFLLAVLRRSTWVRAVEQAWDENFETSASDGRAW